ncbi:GreA/GreB family elongation factor [Shewanella waksmanii]|uniref:GreA/GreB family elongation factor n=1 Tax=Shewanella waksmanii TaxID=213783 RepID=UPI00048B0583|nr:GreA/GreB family elongation factor [Shewanella waksmanii]
MKQVKPLLIRQIIHALTQLHRTAKVAANQAHATATHSESVARSKYETFGLEASYLAHGQTQRVAQLAQNIDAINALPVRYFQQADAIAVGALVFIEDTQQQLQALFISPCAGGIKVAFDCRQIEADLAIDEVMLITPASPLGAALLGKYLDEQVRVDIAGNVKLVEIIAVY